MQIASHNVGGAPLLPAEGFGQKPFVNSTPGALLQLLANPGGCAIQFGGGIGKETAKGFELRIVGGSNGHHPFSSIGISRYVLLVTSASALAASVGNPSKEEIVSITA